MDVTFMREAVTVLSFTAFVAILAYVLHPANRKRFDDASRIVFDDEHRPSPQPSPMGGEGASVGCVVSKGGAGR
ncbi:MAG: cbb3-type cytochrome oxidase subunit 3 [Usitatibacter sp.]